MGTVVDGVQVTGAMGERYDSVLTPEALELLAELHRTFDGRRLELLRAREDRYAELAAGGMLDFLAETQEIREGDWQVAPPAPGLVDRRVEITGPTDRKMTINALNSGAKVWLADFEDASTPTWTQRRRGPAQPARRPRPHHRLHLRPRARPTRSPADELATIVVRPRGWHLPEKHITVDGEPMSGALVDFGLYFFHCAPAPARRRARARTSTCRRWRATSRRGSGTTCSCWPRNACGIPRGTIRATVLVETYPAAFEMEEILYELREHSSGLNAGRWDYIFSVIKKFRTRGKDFLLPDRNQVTMTVPFMRSYTELLVRTLPQARRPRDRRHGGVHPEQGPRGQRGGVPEGPRRQDP